MTFDAEILHWPGLAAFAAHLATVPKPAWCIGITNHNTYQPDERDWAGGTSMVGMRDYYRDHNGWSAGPHLFLAAGTPQVANDGIWQMTPLAHQGIHAGDCNETRLGIENVGDFQARPPTTAQWSLMLDVNEAIIRAWHLDVANIWTHKECMPGRTCPGRFFSADRMRADLLTRLNDRWTRWGTTFPLPPEQRGWGIPQRWYQDAELLGEARSWETFPDPYTSIQTFQRGVLIYEKLTGLVRRMSRGKDIA